MSPGAVRHRIASAKWHPLRHGQFCSRETWEGCDDRRRHGLLVLAAVRSVTGEAWASHTSAAVLLGLPTPREAVRPYLTREPPGSTRYRRDLVVEVAAVPPKDRRLLGDLPLTSLERTVADCLRHCPPSDGLAILDAALAAQPSSRTGIAEVLQECHDWPFMRKARCVFELGDGLRESPLESWSYWEMACHHLPLPQPQALIYDETAAFIGRVDFWWPKLGVIGEADGSVKYEVAANGDTRRAQAALEAEKRREDRLRATGADVVRWGARDLRQEGWAERLLDRLRQGRGRHFRGTAVVQPERR